MKRKRESSISSYLEVGPVESIS